jgi:hypothetical protein
MFTGGTGMFTIDELQQQIEAYRDARASRQDLFDWFESRSFDAYENHGLRAICVAIDTAFSEFFYDGSDEETLKKELATAVRAFALSERQARIRYIPLEHNREPLPTVRMSPSGSGLTSGNYGPFVFSAGLVGKQIPFSFKPPAVAISSAQVPIGQVAVAV